MKFRPRHAFFLLALALVPLGAVPGRTQDFDRPGGFDDGGSYGRDQGDPSRSGGVDTPDPGELGIRVGKLESRIRDMTGQIEELQNANRKLVEQLQKFQADVDARMTSGGGLHQKRSELEKSKVAPAESAADDPAMDADSVAPKLRRPKRDDSFDPGVAATGAPGKPKPLGSAASAQPDDTGSGAPMDLAGGRLAHGDADGGTLAPTLRLPSSTPKQQPGGTVTPNGTVIASTGPTGAVPNTPRGEFDAALALYRDKQYDDAGKGFTAFIQKNPKSKLAADATYYLGESFAQRGRSREAAEQYLKISTEFATSSRAPDAMLHLGMSLKALGAKEQACATFSEVTRKYPNAPAYVKSGAEREAKRAQC